VPSSTNYNNTILAKFKNESRDSDYDPCTGACHHRLGFDVVYLHAKFDDSSFDHTRDITWSVKI